MQPTLPKLGGGKWFGPPGHSGSLTQRGVVTYQLSPYQQRPLAGAMKKGIFNVFRRTSQQLPYVIPAFVLFYVTYSYGNGEHAYMATKEYKKLHGEDEE
ncbi:putative cytochrome b-c1 complex subunit 8 [Piptocephalis cylindrospora]|uniref:Cytochrome b-c1 complex subunit 8 n=1 Tax=Piptocephalis cylindrospora TaxID=1907219 RepID=A0A4P9Y7F6_9FUNG|nr:putative cytochrome b-c1 complex subunit 8 [Piptocephalis cylindrospora]|eukprot:RKP15067.1 putative cytochrome b-c1 complex subunit 8 [Piptocephalis cylindrospora]